MNSIPKHLADAGFKESSPGYYERGDAVIRYTSAARVRPFSIFSTSTTVRANFESDHVGEAILLASMLENADDMTGTILGDAMSSVAFAMTSKLRGLDFGTIAFSDRVQRELDHAALRLAALIASEVQRAGALPKDPPFNPEA